MWNWFRRLRSTAVPGVHQTTAGELKVPSGALILTDPMDLSAPVRVEGIPPGQYPIHALVIHYPQGGKRVARLGLSFRPGQVQARRTLGTVDVSSAKVVAVDAASFETCWREVGLARVGITSTPGDHRRVARLIERRFGLTAREVNFLSSCFEEPISEELEERITSYLATFPEYAHTFMYFRVETRNTAELVSQAMGDRLWAEVPLGTDGGSSLLAFRSGFGDGGYPVLGLYGPDDLLGIEVEFIGPAQDEVLKAFPMLRYG